MRSSNPAFASNQAFSRGGYATFDVATPSASELEEQYAAPVAVARGRMTVEDVVTKTAILFAVLLATAVPTYFWIDSTVAATDQLPGLAVVATFGAMIGALVLGMVIAFTKTVRPTLMLGYAALQGVFVGGFSGFIGTFYGGDLIPQAVLGTLVAFGAMLIAYRTGLVKAGNRFRKILVVASLGYLGVGLVNLVAAFGFGYSLYFDSPLGVLLSLVGVTLASLFLVLDFDFVEQGVRNGLPAQYSWSAGFGFLVTLVWLYIELLRLLAILRGE